MHLGLDTLHAGSAGPEGFYRRARAGRASGGRPAISGRRKLNAALAITGLQLKFAANYNSECQNGLDRPRCKPLALLARNAAM